MLANLNNYNLTMALQIKDTSSGTFCLLLAFMLCMSFDSIFAQEITVNTENDFPSMHFAGFMQQQFVADQNPDVPATFSIKRARVGVAGAITKKISLNLIGGYVEPPDNTPRLVNAFIDFDIHPLLQLRTGQFLLPFGLEGPEPIFLNPAIERSHTVRRINTFTMFRDMGIQLSGKKSKLGYALAFVNGAGANSNAGIDPKDFMGRIYINPLEYFTIGISGHLGSYQPVPGSDDYEARTRAGVDLSYENEVLLVRWEWILRRDNLQTEGNLKMGGGYLLGGYRFSKQVETIARLEYFEPNTSVGNDELKAYTLGANFYFLGNTRLSVNYELIEDRINPDFGNQLTIQMQVVL